MSVIFSYRDNEIYSHHSIDQGPDESRFVMHAHEWFEILYIISGSGTYMVEGNQYPMDAGDIFILRPAEMHKLQIETDSNYERMVIHFSPELIKRFGAYDGNTDGAGVSDRNTDTSSVAGGGTGISNGATDAGGASHSSLTYEDYGLLGAFYDRPLGVHNRYAGNDKSTKLLYSAFAGFEFDNIGNPKLNLLGRLIVFLTTLDGIYREEKHQRLHIPAEGFQSQLLEYVNEHLFEDISVQTVADAFYRSRSQISRVFRQATDSSLWDYVTIKRLMAARAMIQRGEPANKACTACGFSEYSSFYRAYKSHFGHSPKEDAGKE